MNNERVLVQLQVVAAKAAQLVHGVQHNQLWPGDLEDGIAEILKAMQSISGNKP